MSTLVALTITLLFLLWTIRGALTGRWGRPGRHPHHRNLTSSARTTRSHSTAPVLFAALGVTQLVLDWSDRLSTIATEQPLLPILFALLLMLTALGLRLPGVEVFLTVIGATAGLIAVWLQHGPVAAAVVLTIALLLLWLNGLTKLLHLT